MDYEVRQQLRVLIHRAVVPDYVRERKEQKKQLQQQKKRQAALSKTTSQSKSSSSSSSSSKSSKRSRAAKATARSTPTLPIKRPAPSTFTVNSATMKSIKGLARLAPCNVLACHELLSEPLTSNNSETRLMALLITNELFERSKHFRNATANHIKEFVQLTVGGKMNTEELPLPKDAAKVLRKKSILFFENWHIAHGVHFQSIRVAYQYMSNSLNVVFPKAIEAAAVRQQEQALQAEQLQHYKRTLLDIERVELEMKSGALLEIEDHSIILENCLLLLVPGSTDPGTMLFTEYEEQHQAAAAAAAAAVETVGGELEEEVEEDEWIDTSENKATEQVHLDSDEDSDEDSDYEGESWSLYDNASREAMNALGITSEHFELKIHVSSIKAKILEQTSDHCQYIEPTMRDCIQLTETRYVPMLREWMNVHTSYLQVMQHDNRNDKVRVAATMLQRLENTCNGILQRTKKAKELLVAGRPRNKLNSTTVNVKKRKKKNSKSGTYIVVDERRGETAGQTKKRRTGR